MLWWRKGLLVFLVVAAHVGALYGLNVVVRSGKPSSTVAPNSVLKVFVLVATSADRLQPKQTQAAPKQAPSPAINAPVFDIPTAASPNDGSAPMPTDFPPEQFLTAEDLDQTATAPESFSAALGQSLPLAFTAVEIEFWIDATGRTVQVVCVDENCTTSISENLHQLLSLVFSPAIKNNFPVSSRKRVLIEPAPTFGL